MKFSVASLSAAVVVLAAMHSPVAHAGVSAANASGLCQGALPAFDTNIRKRPLAVANEGTAAAFVSCSIPFANNASSIDDAVVMMVNRNETAVDVGCTFVDGVVAEAGLTDLPAYYPQTVTLEPGVLTPIIWEPADYGLTSFSPYENFNCKLPPGVEINLVGYDYTDAAP
jgi:hypothetical protein